MLISEILVKFARIVGNVLKGETKFQRKVMQGNGNEWYKLLGVWIETDVLILTLDHKSLIHPK